MILRFLPALFLLLKFVASSSKKRSFEEYNTESEDKSASRIRHEDTIEALGNAIKNKMERTFTFILKSEGGCDLMDPRRSDLLSNLIKERNEKFLYLLFSEACPNSYDLYMKTVDMAYNSGDRLALRAVLNSIYNPFVTLSNELIDYFLDRDDLDAILMILDIGFSLEKYSGHESENIAHVAIENDRLDIVKAIKHCSVFYKPDCYGKTPIFYTNNRRIIKEIRRKCPRARDQMNYKKLTTWQESLISGDFDRLNSLISLKRRIKKFKRTFLNFYNIGWYARASIITVNRENILMDSFNAVQRIRDKWYRPMNEFFIKYIGEIGIDSGGLKVDWVANLFKKFFSSSDSQTVFVKIDDYTGFYAPNTKYPPAMFKFAGSIVGLSIGLGVPMKVKLIPSMYMTIYEEDLLDPMQLLQEQSPTVYNNLFNLNDPSIKLSDLGLSFPCDPLKTVTRRNLMKYIEEYSHFSVFGAYENHIKAFIEGFKSVLGENITKFVTKQEFIELLKGRSDNITAKEFIDACNFGNNLRLKADFYEIVIGFTAKQSALLLKFVTGTETLPIEGFSGLKNGGIHVCVLDELWDSFPTSSTCSNLLKLPPYDLIEELNRKLLYAIEMTETIDNEPGVNEQDGIVLGMDAPNTRVNVHQPESESDVSSDEENKLIQDSTKPHYERLFKTF